MYPEVPRFGYSVRPINTDWGVANKGSRVQVVYDREGGGVVP